ncbi:MAG: glutamate--cysteine ligase [Gammaproteobacteria bacterium]|jgi:glutamate--cysteine ligase|nr:glutamate--cysteine ligase [Gammaproteobacteria bacterium]
MPIQHLHPVPHLTTVLNGPLLQLESHLLNEQAKIESWLRRQWQQTQAPFYASVDLRNAGFKLAPVDTNLFPAGFNNLNPAFMPLCVQATQAAIEHVCPTAHRAILIPEDHTRNPHYLDSLATLLDIMRKAGLDVRLGSLRADLEAPEELTAPSGQTLLLEPLQRTGDEVHIGDFRPCLVLLNNDLAAGRPPILEGLRQNVAPPLELGWSNRLKSDHFARYREVAAEFAALIDIDPWLIDPLHLKCGEINFMKREGEDCLAANVEELLRNIRRKYEEYGVDREPYVVVKADAGTYGMGVMTARSPDDVRDLNRKERTRMAASKGGMSITRVIMQEGVYTFETWGDAQSVAEPVIYMIDHFVVGGFYRVHTRRGPDENLNAPGMYFEPLAFADACTTPERTLAPDAEPNRFYAYGVIARLALLAAAREMKRAGEPRETLL